MIKLLKEKALVQDLEPIQMKKDKRYLNAIAIKNDKEIRYLPLNDEGYYKFDEVKANDIIEVSCINLVEYTEIQYYYIVLCIDKDILILSRKFDNYNEISFLKKAIIINHFTKTKLSK